MKIYWGEGVKNTALNAIELNSRQEVFNRLIDIKNMATEKGGHFISTGSDYALTKTIPRRNNKSYLSSWAVALDIDKGKEQPQEVVKRLRTLNLNYIIYTTFSHTKKTPSFRVLIFCNIPPGPNILDIHRATVDKIALLLDVKIDNVSRTPSQLWFLPVIQKDGKRPFIDCYLEGIDLKPAKDFTEPKEFKTVDDYMPIDIIISIIISGESPLHETIRKYIYGAILDGRAPAEIKATLHGLTAQYDLTDARLKARKEDINRRVDSMYKKKFEQPLEVIDAEWHGTNEGRVFTNIPDQLGNMETLIQYYMSIMRFPNRQIATATAYATASVLCSRVYFVEPINAGVVWSCKMTGRSTIGKDMVKKGFIQFIDEGRLNKLSADFVGSYYYTSSKNLLDDVFKYKSLLAILGESGHSDKSSAGDMPRFLGTLLNLMTQSGPQGILLSGGQNEKVKPAYSPAATIIKESVGDIQKIADSINMTSITGEAGRFNHILIDPYKMNFNKEFLNSKIPRELAKIRDILLTLVTDIHRPYADKPIPLELWVPIKVADEKYFFSKFDEWTRIENVAAEERDDFTASSYGRLYEKIPAYSGLNAVMQNPKNPVITNEILDMAETSLIAQVEAFISQEKSGEFDLGWSQIIGRIKDLMSGDLSKKVKLTRNCKHTKLLKAGCCTWTAIRKNLSAYPSFQELSAKDGNFKYHLEQQLELVGIIKMNVEDSLKHGTRAVCFQRIA